MCSWSLIQIYVIVLIIEDVCFDIKLKVEAHALYI